MKTVELKKMPSNWNAVTMEQFRILEQMKARYASKEAYLTYCFIYFQGLKPLLYSSRWKEILSQISFLRRFIRMDGRRIQNIYSDYLGVGEPIVVWEQCYRYNGWKNLWKGDRFWMEDQQLLSFLRPLEYLTTPIQLAVNPIPQKTINDRIYTSAYTRLADMSWLDYNKCSMHIEQYVKTKQTKHLYNFIACLYKIGDPDIVQENFDTMELYLIQIFWQGCQTYFKKCFPHLFSVNEKKQKQKDYLKEESEISVFLSKQAYSKPDEVREMLVFDALEYLEQNAKECEERQREIDKIKSRR